MATDIPMNTLEHVIYGGAELNAFDVAGCKWRKPYIVTIPSKPTGVASITITRSASESNCDQLSATSLTSTGKVLYGDTVSISAAAATGYNDPTTSFTSGVSNNKVIGDVAVSVTAGTGKTYYIYYNKGTSTSGTLPSTTSRTYPNAATIATNNMAKSNTTANSYTVTYLNGTATSGTLPNAQTSINTTTYTKNGWTTSASNYNDPDYANGTSFGANSTTNLTLYPNFTTNTTNGGVTLGTNNMSKSNTTVNSYTITYAQGNASSTTNLPSKQTSVNTTTYTKNGWTTTSGSTTKTHANGAATGALTGNLTLYPCFSQSTTNGGVTVSSNTMSKNNTTENGYKVTYAQGTATSTTVPSAQTATNTRSYTHSGWTTSQNGSKTYNKGASTGALSSNITLYPYFDSFISTYGAVKLASNTMTKSNTTANSYTVTYAQGNASNTTNLPSKQTSINTTTYTANGWTTTSGSTTQVYANGASTGALTSNITVYPCFSQNTTNGGVTLSSNTMSRSNTTENGCTVTYAQGNASNTTNLPSKQTATNTRSYTHNGWATSASGAKAYGKGSSTGALSGNLTLYPYFDSSISTYGSVTVSSNTMSKSSTTENGYTLTYNKGTATSTNVPSAQTATDTRSYTHNGWATSASGSKAYNKGASTGALSSSITLYPYFDSSVTRGSVTLATNNMTKSNTNDYSYTVTYNYNGSGAANTTATATKVRTYAANGWTTTSGSATRTYANGQSVRLTSAITVYPCFTQSTSGGSVTLPTPTRANYTFKGWNTSSTATSGATGSYTPTGNVTLYAIWAANATASASITFPAIPITTVRTYTQTAGSNRIFSTSKETQYNDYSAYTSCTIDGVDVTGSYFVTVKETGGLLNTTIYRAKFTGGVLYVKTTAQGVGTNTTTSMRLSASAYSTTATFSSSHKSLTPPEVYIAQSVEDELYLEISNNNDTAVTFDVTVYDRYDMAYGAESKTLSAGEMDSVLYVPLSSSVTSGYIEAYFTADGYEDSGILTQEWEM